MSQSAAQSVPAPPVPPAKSPLKDGHFLAAAGVLLAAVVGFSILATKVTLVKLPVPARGVTLDDQRLSNFPGRAGTYFLSPRFKDGDKVGLLKVPRDQIELLGIRQHADNWYYMAAYDDSRAGRGLMYPPMQLDITYYTGLLDAVPHVGDNCIVAGGGTILDDRSGPVAMTIDSLPEEWSKRWGKFTLQRTAFEAIGKDGRHVYFQYHVFSVNGQPMTDRNEIRATLSNPFKKYFYYAKIQVAPFAADLTAQQSDELCSNFLTAFLPEILKSLPTEGDVRQLEDGR